MKTRLSVLALFVFSAALVCCVRAEPFELPSASRVDSDAWPVSSMLPAYSGSPAAPVGEQKPLQEGPVDPRTYLLGPGDVLRVEVWGAASLGYPLEVDAEGKVLIPDSGTLSVAGLSLGDARELIKKTVLAAIRRGQVDVRLVRLRQFKVHVSGEVERAGSYVASASTRVSELLGKPFQDLTGPGLRDSSSLRNIQLRRRDGTAMRADLVAFFLAGDTSLNPFVSDGDVIHVPRAKRYFVVSGGVMFPGTYEFLDGEKLSQALRLAGGVTPEADMEKGEISRFVDRERRESIQFRLASVLGGQTDFDLREGDGVYVRTPTHYLERHQVYIGGEVVFPGWYSINRREDTLSELVARAGGLTPQADLSSARVIRPDSLPSGELARVRTDFVKLLAGAEKKEDVVLEAGDLVEIPAKVDYVLVSGEVRRPGYVRYVPDKRAGFYVREAGGYTDNASGGKTLVKRFSAGQSLSSREAGYVRPNDEVFVPTREEGARWALFKDTVSLLAQLATVYIVVHEATKD
ncbi:MAG: SLBB domain-containing protein [Candidatus Eisenbacteria bacterium]|nr:SLBB domain-containing protein [Candidatus Eisenbacteria bacterium]